MNAADYTPSLKAYLEAILFAEDIDDRTIYEFDDESIDQSKADLDAFVSKCPADLFEKLQAIDKDFDDLGRDFYFTRNRHGVGFWDGYWKEFGDELTKLAHEFNEVYIVEKDAEKLSITWC